MPPSISIGAAVVAGEIEDTANLANLGLASRDERLTAETRVHRHHEHEVDVAGNRLERSSRGGRVEDDARLRAERLDRVHGPMQMGKHLHVHRDHRRAGFRERLEVAIGLLDHQVHVERDTRRRA